MKRLETPLRREKRYIKTVYYYYVEQLNCFIGQFKMLTCTFTPVDDVPHFSHVVVQQIVQAVYSICGIPVDPGVDFHKDSPHFGLVLRLFRSFKKKLMASPKLG